MAIHKTKFETTLKNDFKCKAWVVFFFHFKIYPAGVFIDTIFFFFK